MEKNLTLKVDNREFAAILAGLRRIQETEFLDPDITTIFTNAGEFAGLDNDEIDNLCERLNLE